MLKRLAFRLPEYAPRTTWGSEHAREVWESRLRRISQAWMVVEQLLVKEGVRPSALQNIAPEDLPDLLIGLAGDGLTALPLTRTLRANGYQSAAVELTPGSDWDYRCA